MSITTETITSETGTVWTVTCETCELGFTRTTNITTNITAERDGNELISGPVYLVEGRIHPSIKPAVMAAVRRLEFVARGITEESEAARIAAIDAVDKGYEQITKAMNL
jgi:hypothetical protein